MLQLTSFYACRFTTEFEVFSYESTVYVADAWRDVIILLRQWQPQQNTRLFGGGVPV